MIESPPSISAETLAKDFNLYLKYKDSDLLKKINNEYLYWDRIKYKSEEIDPILFWRMVKVSRNLNAKNIVFGKYIFRFFLTDYIQKTLHDFDMNIGGNLGSNISMAETDKTKFLVSSLMEEAISSSQMEGAVTTRKKAKDMLQKEINPRSKSEQMIVNNYLTIRHITQHKSDKITVERLKYVHSLISKGTLDRKEDEGVFRSNDDIHVVNNMNGEVVHQPPRHEEVLPLLEGLCDFFNDDEGEFVHPILKGIIIHFMIAWIHPFSDGNGRTARTLFYWYLLSRGYWLTEYLSISRIIKGTKNQYEQSYLHTEMDDNDLSYFITYNLKTMNKAFIALKEYINRKQQEVNQAAKFLRINHINERQAQILKLVNDDSDRVLNIKEMENRFQVSNFTARGDLNGLVESGYLQSIQVNKIKRNYVKSATFDILLKKAGF